MEENQKFRIRNSHIKDWETMCKEAFRYRWFGEQWQKDLFDISNNKQVRWGVYFETLILGSGFAGKTVELSESEIKSVYYKRVKKQAEAAREYLLKELGTPILYRQHKVLTEIDVDGVMIPVEQNIDAIFGYGTPSLIVDTKLTGDTSNTYGDFAWGKPESMDMGQLVNYKLGVESKYGVTCRTMYYIADNSEKERVEIIEPIFTDAYIEQYKWRLYDAYTAIKQSLMFNYFEPSPSYNKCKQCPARDICKFASKFPEITEIVMKKLLFILLLVVATGCKKEEPIIYDPALYYDVHALVPGIKLIENARTGLYATYYLQKNEKRRIKKSENSSIEITCPDNSYCHFKINGISYHVSQTF